MDITNDKWAARMLNMAKHVAAWSKDESTKVGAFITTKDGSPVSWGFNGMAMGINDNVPDRHERPMKYKWMCHAERNALDLSQSSTKDCVMFVTHSVCSGCAQSIIQNRISTVIVDEAYTIDKMPERWHEDMTIASEMLKEAGIDLKYIKSS